VDIFRQLAAQSRHALTQSSIPPMASQLFAQASQISAQIPQSATWNDEPDNWKLADVWHISAQFIINRK